METGAFKIETVTGRKVKELVAVENDLHPTFQNMQKFLAVMPIGAFTGRAGREHEAVALHLMPPFRKRLDGDAGGGRWPGGPMSGTNERLPMVSAFLTRQGGQGRSEAGGKRVQRRQGQSLGDPLERR